MRLAWLLLSLFWERVSAALPTFHEYLIVSVPLSRTVSYIKMSDDAGSRRLRPLIDSGLVAPTSIAMDRGNMRLFIADAASEKIFWYNVMHLADGSLITDGHQHVGVSEVQSSDLALNAQGDLFFSGRLLLAPPNSMEHAGIFRHSAIAIAMGQQLDPVRLWDRGFSNGTAWSPGPLAVDCANIYWGNVEAGSEHGSVLRGPAAPAHIGSASSSLLSVQGAHSKGLTFGAGEDALTDEFYEESGSQNAQQLAPVLIPAQGSAHAVPPAITGVSSNLLEFADNADRVRGVASTARFVFYSTPAGVYAVDKARGTAKCVGSQDCLRVDAGSVRPMGLAWDGDGSVYIADQRKGDSGLGQGGVYRIPSGDRNSHLMEYIAAAPGVEGLAYLSYVVTNSVGRKYDFVGAVVLSAVLFFSSC